MKLPDATSGDRHEADRRLHSPEERYGARLSQRGSSVVLQERLAARERQSLDEALSRVVDDGSAVAVASAIVAARRRFITGRGKSLAYATLLASDLSAGLSLVTLLDDAVVRAVDILSEVRATDVLIAFSMRRYRRDTVELCRQFVKAGGTVLAITDDADSPVADIAAVSVVVSTESASYADSPTAVAAVSHIIATLATASSKGARRRLSEQDRITRELGIYLDD
ncbi:MAG: hypothetical protein QOE16_1903 [Microbacteriaceae bacterium]|jgi:DNA-binding MurR/RpiR family transcriptional regulator|nr:hypothetical protein [Microbacteriaceae bacterium]